MLNRRLALYFKICLLIGILPTFCQNAGAMDDYSAQQLKRLIDSGKPIFLLNPLSEIEFNEAHIPGSVNISAERIMKSEKLPKDKDMLIITYCKGPK